MNERITADSVIEWLSSQVAEKHVIGPHVWMDAAQKLTVLIGDEHDKLFDLQQQVAQMKVKLMDDGATAAKAKIYVEASDTYKQMCKQRAKIEGVEEMICVTKIQARMKDNEQSSY